METDIKPLGGSGNRGAGPREQQGCRSRGFSLHLFPPAPRSPQPCGSVWGQHRGVSQWLMSLSPEVVRDTGWVGQPHSHTLTAKQVCDT